MSAIFSSCAQTRYLSGFKSERTEGVILGELVLDKCALRPEEFTGNRWIDLADLKPCIIPVAQGEPKIGPDSMSDDIGWKSVAGIEDGLHGRNSKVARAAKLPIEPHDIGLLLMEGGVQLKRVGLEAFLIQPQAGGTCAGAAGVN